LDFFDFFAGFFAAFFAIFDIFEGLAIWCVPAQQIGKTHHILACKNA
jgi:hypothetical protein